jgi:mannose-6-phosphate isomerase-like protein (cupin superfamily)
VSAAFDLEQTYLALDGRGAVARLPVGPDCGETIDQSPAAHGSLVMVGESLADWTVWEMHPNGDEIIYLLSGEMELVFEGLPSAPLAPGRAVIVPRGVWHTARVAKPSKALFITFGEGTQRRPRAENIA